MGTLTEVHAAPRHDATRVLLGLGIGRPLRRAARVVRLSASHAFQFFIWGSRSRRPHIVRAYLQTLGGAFLKLGQVLAMRYDLLPARYCDELNVLLDRLPAVDFTEIEAIIEQDLGRPCTELFDHLDRVPVSTASVAQVHRGALPDGQQVAVKVMRPGVRVDYRTDLTLIRFLARALAWIRPPASVDLEGFVGELTDLANEELDFRVEARHAAILRESMIAGTARHYAPKVFPDLSGSRVLTLEWLEGVSVNDLLRAVSSGDVDRLRELAARGVVPEDVGRTLCESIVVQCFGDRVFHADPHAANLVVLEDGRLGYVDCGMIGWIDEGTWRRHLRLNLSIATGDLDGAYQALLDTFAPLPARDLRRFERAFKQLLQRWVFATRLPSASLRERSVALFFSDVFALCRAEGLRMPSEDMRLNRALLVADILVLKLCPELLRLPLLERFFKDELKRLIDMASQSPFTLRASYDSLFAALDTPAALREISHALRARALGPPREPVPGPTRLERAAHVALGYARLLVLIVVVLVAVSPVSPVSPVNPVNALDNVPWRSFLRLVFQPLASLSWRWTTVVAGLVLFVAVGRIMRALK